MDAERDSSINDVFAKTASEINRNLPMMVDQLTRLDATAALPGRKLLYRYTLLNGEWTENEIIAEMRTKLINNYRTSRDMEELRKMGVTLVYHYSDEAGNELAQFDISAGDIQ